MITLSLLVRATYMYGVVLHARPVRGESHNQRNTTGEVATGAFGESAPKLFSFRYIVTQKFCPLNLLFPKNYKTWLRDWISSSQNFMDQI